MAPKKRAGPPESKFCDLRTSRGITVCYEDFHGPTRKEYQGDNEEFVFMILGSAADLRKTADQQYIRQSEGYFRIMTYDHRNTGRTTIKDESCTMQDYADDAAALLEAVCPENLPVNVVGISFGGMVAQHLALRHPHLVKKLVLCCCGTGGETGSSYPIHTWYEPGVTVEDRVQRKTYLANLERTEEWKKANDRQWVMIHAMVSRDEGCGKDEPLRWEGVNRQLEARKLHDTTDAIGQLQCADILVCGSPLDGISPPKLQEALAERIGGRCERRLDFAYGHPFLAADTEAMAFVNQWLRKPLPEGWLPPLRVAPPLPPRAAANAGTNGRGTGRAGGDEDEVPQIRWEVVGGGDKGGIIVRTGAATTSDQAPVRLSTGAIVEELDFLADAGRLRYRLLAGTGPDVGWISIKLKEKDLAVRIEKAP